VNLLEAGQTEKGLEWLRRAEEGDPDDALNLYNIACVYANLGEIEKAIDYLEQSVRKGMVQMDWITHDTDLDNLRDHPRFKALLPTE
jgi:adenylate cyclase